MWGVDGRFQPAQSFQTYKKDKALARINTAQSEVFSEETHPLDLSWVKKKKREEKGLRIEKKKRKEVLGAPPVRQLEFLQPQSAYQGSWKWGRGR